MKVPDEELHPRNPAAPFDALMTKLIGSVPDDEHIRSIVRDEVRKMWRLDPSLLG